MDSEKLKLVEDLYHEAADLPPDEVSQFLTERCGDDAELRGEVESLLSYDSTPDSFIDGSVGSFAAEMFADRKPGTSLNDKTIGHYKVIRLIGAGGMGQVYLAEDTKLDRKVALKILPGEFAEDTNRMSRFVREAKSASALNHPNIITIYEINEFEGIHFIATEFIDGKTLNHYLKDNPISLAALIDIAIQIASALDEAHQAGLVHRDIKPENVMIRNNGVVKVLDFGLAKASAGTLPADSSSEEPTKVQFQTQPGLIIGTPNYMSPEQARGKQLDHQTDIFSFGVVFHEMLSGNQLFKGETVSDVIAGLLTDEPARLSDVPPDIERIVFKALMKSKAERYQTTKALLDDLKKVQKHLEREDTVVRIGSPTEQIETQIFDNSTVGEDSTFLVAVSNSNDEIDRSPNNLSSELSPMIGRTDELAKITELINQPKTRLLTLTGVGGTGKTTLAKALATEALRDFPDGVFFIELAAIGDHELVEQVIAQALGLKETSGTSLEYCLKDFLSGRRILLILDNFEQITKASAKIGELLTESVNLKIVVTSRVRLNLRFEQEYTLQPLEIPTEETLTADQISKYSAVALFVERAKAVKADFALTEENSEAVAAICRRLDGLPLAIELAAVQVKMFAPKAIRKRLETNLQILASGAGDLPERQRTMFGAIAWSYDLLEEDEKQLFVRSSIFRGGFTLDAAEAICNVGGGLDIFKGVTALVDKSLLVQREQFDGEPRLKMLQVVREFARETLGKGNQENDLRHLHAAFFADLAEKAEIGFRGEKASEWLETIELEHDNYRAALEWTLLHEPQTAMRITAALPQFWFRRGHLAEGNKWSRRALEAGEGCADPRLLVRVFMGIGSLMWRQGDLIEAEKFYAEAVKLSREIPDKLLIATSLSGLGTVKMLQGNNAEALTFLEESFNLSGKVNDKYLTARLANTLGELFRSNEDHPTAKNYYEKALTIARQESFKDITHLACVNLSAVACSMEDYKASREYALESINLSKEAGDTVGIGFALERFMALAVIEGEPEKAARIYGGLEGIYESAGFMVEAVDQAFLDIYLDQARAAIGEEKYLFAKMEGRVMSVEKTVMLAVENNSPSSLDDTQRTRSTAEVAQGDARHSTKDSLKATAIYTTDEMTVAGVSGPKSVFSQMRSRRSFLAVLAAILLSVGGFFGYRYFTGVSEIRSIAVIPFANNTGSSTNDYVSDGLSDSTINRLSQLPHLTVISRTSTFRYKGKELDVDDVARSLGVQAIITGQITQQGDTLQINVEMIRASDKTRLWGEIYTRKVSEEISVPEAITQAVAQRLEIKLSPDQERQMVKQITSNTQAYQLHMNGIFFRRKNGAENIRKAIEYQEQAIKLDLSFTRAYVELSINYANLVDIRTLSPAEGLPKARAAAERALALDETLAEAHYNIARIRKYEFEWTAAETAFKRSIELNPNLAAAHTIYAEFLSQLGRFDEALREVRLAKELDPMRTGLVGNEGSIYYFARQYDEAIVKKQIHVSAAPDNPFAHLGLGNALAAKGQFAEAIDAYQTSIKLEDTSSALIYLGRAYALTGRRDEALAILIKVNATEKYVSPAELAMLYAALGDNDGAFSLLERAYKERDIQMTSLKVDPGYDPIRNDPRFTQMLKRLNLPE